MMLTRRPLCHPLAGIFWRAVDSIATSLSPDTVRGYRATTRSFLRYLGTDHHQIHCLEQLRRDPHILGWLVHLRSQTPPIVLADSAALFLAGEPVLAAAAATRANKEAPGLTATQVNGGLDPISAA